MTKAQPKPQSRRRLQHAETPLGNLLNEFDLSLSDLQNMLNDAGVTRNCSPATLSRIIRNVGGTSKVKSDIRPSICEALRKYMLAQSLPKAEIDARLTAVFSRIGEYQPMILERIRLKPTELKFFGLAEDPFLKDPECREDVYFPPEYREIFDAVIDAVKYRHFVAVLGAIGSGKSTLQAMVQDHLETNPNLRVVWPQFYNQGILTPFEVARCILQAFDTKAPGRATALAAAVTAKLRALTENGNRVALMYDNCHEMRETTVRAQKKFLEMGSGGFKKYLGIVFWGWPSFLSLLETPDFQEIYERLHVINMPAFPQLAAGYLEHRYKLCGLKLSNFFDDDAIAYIAANSETPLGAGNIANQAMRKSMEKFGNKKVIGKSLRSLMLFDNRAAGEPGFRRR